MFCFNCGSATELNAQYCGNCGTRIPVNIEPVKQQEGFDKQHQERSQSKPDNSEFRQEKIIDSSQKKEESPNSNPQVEKVKEFLKNNLFQISKTIITKPIQGSYDIFSNAGPESYSHAIILLFTCGLSYILAPYIMMGEMRKLFEFKYFMFIGSSIIIILLLISTITFFLKSLSGKPDFKKELLTGAICGIPTLILLVAIILIKIISGDDLFNILNSSWNSILKAGIGFVVLLLYLFLLMSNIVQQSLKSSRTNDALSWYISPLVIISGFYFGFKISNSLFN